MAQAEWRSVFLTYNGMLFRCDVNDVNGITFRCTFVRSTMMKDLFYYRNLPHWQPMAATFFVTTRLHGSLPMHIVKELKQQKEALLKAANNDVGEEYNARKRYFALYDEALDNNPNGPYYLAESKVAEIVKASLHYRDGKEFKLHAYCIMSNHIHFLATTYETNIAYLWKIMQYLKQYSGREANKVLGRTGNPFWEEEYYDHLVRDEGEFYRIEQYILMNPVKAQLVEKAADWAWSYSAVQPTPVPKST
jgi:putative transposase